jgi:uncharacterized protein (DUF697 family)
MAQKTTAPEMPDIAAATGSAAPAAAGGAVDEAQRDALAAKLVDRFCVWSGAAGLIPLPIIDVATVAGVQLHMLRKLSDMYGIPFSDNSGKSIIASLAGSVIPASSTMGIASALKSVPAFGTAVASAVMPLSAAGSTWVIGRVFIQHFASGGTLLDFNPPDYREFIKSQKNKWSKRSGASGSTAEAAASAPAASATGSEAGKGATGV